MKMRPLGAHLDWLFRRMYGIEFPAYVAALSNRSFDSMSAALLWMMHGTRKAFPEFCLEGKRVLEIGSGQFLSHPVGLRILGAEQVTSIDLHEQFNRHAATLSFQQAAMAKKIFTSEISSRKYNEAIIEIAKADFDLNQLKAFGLEYIAPLDILDYRPPKSFDLVMSYTTLEHVPPDDVPDLLRQSIRLLENGGYFCHFIDLEDHKDPQNNPFAFLDESEWTDFESFTRGNRLRSYDWREIFADLEGIQVDFVFVLERDENLAPLKKNLSSDDFDSGVLVVGKKL